MSGSSLASGGARFHWRPTPHRSAFSSFGGRVHTSWALTPPSSANNAADTGAGKNGLSHLEETARAIAGPPGFPGVADSGASHHDPKRRGVGAGLIVVGDEPHLGVGCLPPRSSRHGQDHAGGDKTFKIKPLMAAMAGKLKRGGRRSRYRLGKQVVEPVFGQIKQARGFRQFFLRGLDNVSAEWSLICTAHAVTGPLATNGVKISMDVRSPGADNVFVERLWRSVKYEEVHLRAYDSVAEARASIGRLDSYNRKRPIPALAPKPRTMPISTISLRPAPGPIITGSDST